MRSRYKHKTNKCNRLFWNLKVRDNLLDIVSLYRSQISAIRRRHYEMLQAKARTSIPTKVWSTAGVLLYRMTSNNHQAIITLGNPMRANTTALLNSLLIELAIVLHWFHTYSFIADQISWILKMLKREHTHIHTHTE